jgi:hypothetical protein
MRASHAGLADWDESATPHGPIAFGQSGGRRTTCDQAGDTVKYLEDVFYQSRAPRVADAVVDRAGLDRPERHPGSPDVLVDAGQLDAVDATPGTAEAAVARRMAVGACSCTHRAAP